MLIRSLSRWTLVLALGLAGLLTPAWAQNSTSRGTGSLEPQGFPTRKSGLWEVRSTGAQSHGLAATRYCVGEKTDQAEAHLDRRAGAKGSCTMGAFKRVGMAWVAESVCREGKVNIISKAVASGDFETEYRIDTVVNYDPPVAGVRKEDKDAILANFIGPCLSNQRAGDMVVPGMGTLNMIDGTFRAEPSSGPALRKKRGT